MNEICNAGISCVTRCLFSVSAVYNYIGSEFRSIDKRLWNGHSIRLPIMPLDHFIDRILFILRQIHLEILSSGSIHVIRSENSGNGIEIGLDRIHRIDFLHSGIIRREKRPHAGDIDDAVFLCLEALPHLTFGNTYIEADL